MSQLRISKDLFEEVYDDLIRPHPFAMERVGFLFARLGEMEGRSRLIIPTKYWPVPDEQYIEDRYVGARFNSATIRAALQYILDIGVGVFLVHMHEHLGRPWFSRTDRLELQKLVPSFQTVGMSAVHGALLLSQDDVVGLVWLPGVKQPTYLSRITIVGYPLKFYARESA